jgi:diadenosine tetraphosphate (Ap4A) HIT family hydrolase
MDEETLKKQVMYRDARVTGEYNDIWQSTGKCVFCDLNEKYIIHEENGIVLTIVLYAYIDGHCMIIPRRHVRSVKELTKSEWETMRKMMYIAKKIIRDVHNIKGMQIIQKDGVDAQSTVDHLHFHCIPFDATQISKWNYRQLANTPIENAELYRQKKSDIEKLAKRFSKKYQDE